MKIPQDCAFVKPFLRMILKIVHSAAFFPLRFGICAQFVRDIRGWCAKKVGRAGTARPKERRKRVRKRSGIEQRGA